MPRPTVQVLLDDGTGIWADDVSAYVDLRTGISIDRGRQDEFTEVQPSTCTMTLDNTSGRFTFGRSTPLISLVANGSFEVDTAGWSPSSGASTIARTATVGGHTGKAALRVTTTGGTTGAQYVPVPISPGTSYTLQARFMPAPGGTSRFTRMDTQYLDDFGVQVSYVIGSPGTTAASGSWTLTTHTSTAPVGATQMVVIPVIEFGAGAGEVFYVDSVVAEAGSTASVYPSPVAVQIDTPIKVRTTVNGVTTDRFTGYVNTWPVEWPGGNKYSEAKITATDRLARLSRRKLRSVLEETIDPAVSAVYYPLTEPEGSTSGGDSTGRGNKPLTPVQRGTGGTIAFGTGTGPPTDGAPAVILTPVDTANGRYLSATYSSQPFSVYKPFDFRLVFNSSTVGNQSLAMLSASNNPTYGLEIALSSTGHVVARFGKSTTPLWTLTDPNISADGRTHDVVVQVVPTTYPNAQVWLFVDGVASVLTTNTVAVTPTTLIVGGGPSPMFMATATMAHVSVTQATTDPVEFHHAMTDGFTADSSDGRIARYAKWANIAASDLSMEAGALASVAHQDTTGMTPAQAMQNVAAAENGTFFVNGAGKLVFQSRSHRYTPTSAVSLIGHDMGADTAFVLDTQGLFNSVTATRDGGATQVYSSASSVAKYEQYPTDLTLLVTTDDEAFNAAAWVVNTHAEPAPRLPSVTVDLVTQTAAKAAAVQALELGTAFTLTALPTQAPTTSTTLFAEGWSEVIGTESWEMTFNTSSLNTVWVLQDATYGALDGLNRLAY